MCRSAASVVPRSWRTSSRFSPPMPPATSRDRQSPLTAAPAPPCKHELPHMSLIRLASLTFREIFPGVRARIVHSERTSQSWVDIDAGASFPEHHHPHEQTVTVLEGTLDLTVNGQLHRLT